MQTEPDPEKKERQRKPYRVIRVTDPHAQPGIEQKLTIKIWPDGLMRIHEHKRRLYREGNVANIYLRWMLRDIARLPRRKRR